MEEEQKSETYNLHDFISYSEYEFNKFKSLSKMKESESFKKKESLSIMGNLIEKLFHCMDPEDASKIILSRFRDAY
jgi:HD superfamily phosphodiesterase